MGQPRTSLSHPLRIDVVPTQGAGEIGLTFCPGKKQEHAATGSWHRDLQTDLSRIADWGAVGVVTLMTDAELGNFQVPALGEQVEALGMEWHHLPVPNAGVPDGAFERSWLLSGARLRGHLAAGRRILVHCRGGLGRTGMVAARLLIELGSDPDDAIAQVRGARPGAIETAGQEEYVRGLRSLPGDGPGSPQAEMEAAAVRLFEMVHELHLRGYQRLRAYPYLSPSGCYWRLEIAPVSAFRNHLAAPEGGADEMSARYSSGDGDRFFGWTDTRSKTSSALAQRFVQQFPGLIEAGRGEDWAYVGWLVLLLREVKHRRLPYMGADWDLDLARGVPMSGGPPFALPPPLPSQDERAPATDAEPSSGLEDDDAPPLPTVFPLNTEEGRVNALLAFARHGEAQLLPFVQYVWGALNRPKALYAQQMAARCGVVGKGKHAVRKVLQSYLDHVNEQTDQWGPLPSLADYPDFEAWNRACFSHFREFEQILERAARKYAAVLGD